MKMRQTIQEIELYSYSTESVSGLFIQAAFGNIAGFGAFPLASYCCFS